MRIVVSSDWHLDASTAGIPRFDDVTKAIDDIVEAVVRTQADMFLFLGDLTDPDSVRCHRAVAFGVQTALKLSTSGVPSRWLVGNHDVIEDGSGDHTLMAIGQTSMIAEAKACERPSHEWIGENVLFVSLPFTARSHAYDPAWYVESIEYEHKPGMRVVVAGHLNIEGIGPGSEATDMPRGRDVFFPVDAVKARWPDALMLNGHIHKPQLFNGIYIPGSPCRFTFGEESNSPSYLVCEV